MGGVGIPAIRSNNRACRVAIAASAAAERSVVARPISTMKSGINGRVITTIRADLRSYRPSTTVLIGVRIAASSKAGR
jgi:hypothetical protein